MTPGNYPYAFRILGPIDGPRKRVNAEAAFIAYCRCEERARVDSEAYLSHFRFDESFREHLAATGSTRDFAGNTWAEELVFDIDAEGDLTAALDHAKKLAATLIDKYEVPPQGFTRYFSGSKGFHISVPTRMWRAEGGPNFHRIAGIFARSIAAAAGVKIDVGVYDRVRALRAPNSAHPKTRLHKRQIPADLFETITLGRIIEMARIPAPFALLDCNHMPVCDGLVWEWKSAMEIMVEREEAAAEQRDKLAAGLGKSTLNRLTLDIIRGEPIEPGDRHRLIYSAARDLAEKGAPRNLLDALLREASLDTGLPPREVDRQLDCGFKDAQQAMAPTGTTPSHLAFHQAFISQGKVAP
jgi:hypothetical protein